jgi:lipoprotein NlpD
MILILLMLMLTACGGSRSVAPVGSYGSYSSSSYGSASPPSSGSSYKVKRGDTLYSISFRYGMDYKELAAINNIRSPYNIYVNQKIYFTKAKSTTSRHKVVTKQKSGTTTTSSKWQPAVQPKLATKPTAVASTTTASSSSANQNLSWRWPTVGKVISTYSVSSAGRKGIDIAGRAGQAVMASAAGKVVYSGNGLARYGNLLIIKHNDVYLSAYAHNQTLMVKEGQYVKAGQTIATLGRSGTQQDQLHFEIRRNGKPVDPLRFLPKQ